MSCAVLNRRASCLGVRECCLGGLEWHGACLLPGWALGGEGATSVAVAYGLLSGRARGMPSTALRIVSDVGGGVLCGLAGTAVMSAFQKFVEMPITGRGESYAPANFAQKIFPVRARGRRQRRRLNSLAHYGLGAGWGAAYGVAAHAGLRAQHAFPAVFGTMYTSDVLLNTALGLYKPWQWSRRDTAIDVVDKLVQGAATAMIFESARARLQAL